MGGIPSVTRLAFGATTSSSPRATGAAVTRIVITAVKTLLFIEQLRPGVRNVFDPVLPLDEKPPRESHPPSQVVVPRQRRDRVAPLARRFGRKPRRPGRHERRVRTHRRRDDRQAGGHVL